MEKETVQEGPSDGPSEAGNEHATDLRRPAQQRHGKGGVDRPACSGRPVVMVVDDDRDTADMYSMALEAAGFKTIPLNDVSSIFATIEEVIPDVVVLDYHLGGVISGVDILVNLRLDARTANVIAFMLSNHTGDLDGQVDRAFSAGAVAWLPKVKTDPAQLAARISQAMAFSATRQSAHGSDDVAPDGGVSGAPRRAS
jgi:two-component system, OmpR family, phosphate regulon response regulator PhoB